MPSCALRGNQVTCPVNTWPFLGSESGAAPAAPWGAVQFTEVAGSPRGHLSLHVLMICPQKHQVFFSAPLPCSGGTLRNSASLGGNWEAWVRVTST